MKFNTYLLALLLCTTYYLAPGQISSRKLKSEGDAYFEHGKYGEALNLYQKYQRLKPEDLETLYRLGLSLYFTNDLDKAKKYLTYVVDNDKKANPQAYYYLGRTFHSSLDFEKAIAYYKMYLRKTKSDNADRESVKDAILRCAKGKRLLYKEEIAVVENLGREVNSAGDDFGTILSPNYNNKLYFSSARKGSIGGMRNNKGLRDTKYGKYNTDIMSTVIVNGKWSATTPLSSLINSARHDRVVDFNDNGSVMYFFKGNNDFSGEILVDTFSNQSDGQPLFADKFKGPIDPENGDHSLFFVDDTTVIFSSYAYDSYGGSDLYITAFRNGQWTLPKNLGAQINSGYDEITPCLARDGKTLYFSSNNLNSMGGFDIFKATYNDVSQQFSKPVNLGKPINSATDDTHFRIAQDGRVGYFTSSRKEGYGMRDIYAAYFKVPQASQVMANAKPFYYRSFNDSGADGYQAGNNIDNNENWQPVDFKTKNNTNSEFIEKPTPNYPPAEEVVPQITLTPIFYKTDDDLFNPNNTRELNRLIATLTELPRVRVLLTCHSTEEGPFALFFSVKRAEKIANYLVENGVEASRVSVKGVGPNYPLLRANVEGGVNPQAEKFNNRVDLSLYTTEEPSPNVTYKMRMTGQIEDQRGAYFKNATKGLSYKVQVAAIKQNYNSPIFSMYPDPMIEASPQRQIYRYTLGLYQTYSSANQLRKELIRQGIPDAYVVAYLDGVRIDDGEAYVKAAIYPDLKNFLARTTENE